MHTSFLVTIILFIIVSRFISLEEIEKRSISAWIDHTGAEPVGSQVKNVSGVNI